MATREVVEKGEVEGVVAVILIAVVKVVVNIEAINLAMMKVIMGISTIINMMVVIKAFQCHLRHLMTMTSLLHLPPSMQYDVGDGPNCSFYV